MTVDYFLTALLLLNMLAGIKYRTRETEKKEISLDLDSYEDLNYAAAAALRAKFAGNAAVYKALKSKIVHALPTIDTSESEPEIKELYSRERRKRRRQESMQPCEWCQMPAQALVKLCGNFYVALPRCQPLTPGHCLVIPVEHVLATTELDEDLYRELRAVLRDINAAYSSKLGRQGLFIENAIDVERCKHTLIECIPLPPEAAANAPLYYQKEFSEAGYEWSNNPKVVNTRGRGLPAAVPKGFPYVHVDFNCEGGLAHVVESRRHYRTLLAIEVARDLLKADPMALSCKILNEAARTEVDKLVNLLA